MVGARGKHAAEEAKFAVEEDGRLDVAVGPATAQLRVRDAVEGAGRHGIAQAERTEP
ncbi:unannotated protein [freshwater metagenome]|uniref:Unannotated protein n=1 Tax=freshwater metagenome TaxID=449393 RepID=A0A6J6Z952_9ZZZZ